MPRRQYVEDLRSLDGETEIPSISGIRAGDDDGTFVFTLYTGDTESSPVEFAAQVWPDASDYPLAHTFKLYTEDDSTPGTLLQKLSRFEDLAGLTIRDYLGLISSAIEVADGKVMEYEDEDFDEEVIESDQDDIYSDGDEHGPSSEMPGLDRLNHASENVAANPELQGRIRQDLNALKSAGFRVGCYGPLLQGGGCHVTASIRVAKLELSDETMAAWSLDRSEYLVLLLSYPGGYRPLEDLSTLPSAARSQHFDLRVGLCHRYKPQENEVRNAFSPRSATSVGSPSLALRHCFIAKPIAEMLRARLFILVAVRQRCRSHPCGWDVAQHGYNFMSHFPVGKPLDDTAIERFLSETQPLDLSNKHLPAVIRDDHLTASRSKHSLPLLAMQCLVRHFVLCTSHCMICWKILDTDLGAIKPYVCDAPLCLYQYVQFGFGSSIEDEIVKQPFVVDLLISLCYKRAMSGKLKDFPIGLNLRVPPTKLHENSDLLTSISAQLEFPHTAQVDVSTWTLRLAVTDAALLKVKDWVVIFVEGQKENPFHCAVIECVGTGEFRLAAAPKTRPSSPPASNSSFRSRYTSTAPVESLTAARATDGLKPNGSSFVEAKFALYNHNFDDTPEQKKHIDLLRMMDLIPPVLEMRKYLLESRSTITGWTTGVPPAAIQILRWIIASCRACIFQVDTAIPNEEMKIDGREERLVGMPNWLQFRIAMGAPDKERRFLQQIESHATGKKWKTLFAWHGSQIHNWHSIIREGLNYNELVNGRAYGDGCYHSLELRTSEAYSRLDSADGWIGSALNVQCVIALNQILNAPDQFVSRSPHLVVQHQDWIQTRYLFVRGDVSIPSLAAKIQERIPDKVFEQEPDMTPMGEMRRIIIPYSTIHQAEKFIQTSSVGATTNKKLKTSESVDASMRWEEESEASDDVDQAVAGVGQPRDILPYEPGGLNATQLPLIPPPEYATPSASRAIMRDLKEAIDLQQTAAHHVLGWTISDDLHDQDFNLYQWIVELHSFPLTLPLAQDMQKRNIQSVVLEMRFAEDYPFSPPFIRVIRPLFVPFANGGGGHVTAGGAICMELLTQSGWSSANSIESVLLQVRMAIMSMDPRPARLEAKVTDYSQTEAVAAYQRACAMHGWKSPPSFAKMFTADRVPGPSAPITPTESSNQLKISY